MKTIYLTTHDIRVNKTWLYSRIILIGLTRFVQIDTEDRMYSSNELLSFNDRFDLFNEILDSKKKMFMSNNMIRISFETCIVDHGTVEYVLNSLEPRLISI
jgi:hypothetical protein